MQTAEISGQKLNTGEMRIVDNSFALHYNKRLIDDRVLCRGAGGFLGGNVCE